MEENSAPLESDVEEEGAWVSPEVLAQRAGMTVEVGKEIDPTLGESEELVVKEVRSGINIEE
jgi:hypothetical protein